MKIPEKKPVAPSSGQVVGAVVHHLNLRREILQSRTAQRYFRGDLVKASSRREIFEALASVLLEAGLAPEPAEGMSVADFISDVASVIDGHAKRWDELRAFMHPRIMSLEFRNLSVMWTAYLRIVAIDLSLRIAVHLLLRQSDGVDIGLPAWAEEGGGGQRLNKLREECTRSRLTLDKFAEEVGVSENSVESWIYGDIRPSDANLVSIACALSTSTPGLDEGQVLSGLRRFYFLSGVADALAEIMDRDDIVDIAQHLHRYAKRVSSILRDPGLVENDPKALSNLLFFGTEAELADPILRLLRSEEGSKDWRADLEWASVHWGQRLQQVNWGLGGNERDRLIDETDGQLLKDWGVSNPSAYAHYQRSAELITSGKVSEALGEVREAVKLDPEDPANHFTLGSVLGSIGHRHGNKDWVDEGLKECWTASTLDPQWLVPRTEIGLILIESGRPQEALTHLEGTQELIEDLDAHFYKALAASRRECGDIGGALESYEQAMKLDSDDARLMAAAAECALLANEKSKGRRYAKEAQLLGFPEVYEAVNMGLFETGSGDGAYSPYAQYLRSGPDR